MIIPAIDPAIIAGEFLVELLLKHFGSMGRGIRKGLGEYNMYMSECVCVCE